jgi:hypothetical protein
MENRSRPRGAGDEHLPQERREWLIQRIAWVVLTAVVIAALLGAFGHGWMSRASVESAGGSVLIEYDRIIRLHDRTKVTLTLNRWVPDGDGNAMVTLAGSYLEHFGVESITPEPEEQQSAPGEFVLKFKPAGEGVPVRVELRLKVERLGAIPGIVRAAGRPGSGAELRGEEVRFEQFALP